MKIKNSNQKIENTLKKYAKNILKKQKTYFFIVPASSGSSGSSGYFFFPKNVFFNSSG